MTDTPKLLRDVQDAWKAHQKSTHVSQAVAAKAMGMKQSALSQYLRGQIPLNTDFLTKFGAVTGTPLGEQAKARLAEASEAVSVPVKYRATGERLLKQNLSIRNIATRKGAYAVEVNVPMQGVPQGAVLLIDPSEPPRAGDMVFVRRTKETSVGRLHLNRESGEWYVLVEGHGCTVSLALFKSDRPQKVFSQLMPERLHSPEYPIL